jgi:hypothetical protein
MESGRWQGDAGASPSVFARREEKYLLAAGVRENMLALLGNALETDGRGMTRIGSLYLDTPDDLLIRRSVEKPDFREKLRVRTYGRVRDGSHPAFFEIKRKYLGTVYKRRVRMTLREARRFVERGAMPPSSYQGDAACVVLNRQILEELRWTLVRYGTLGPSLYVEYERCAYTYRVEGASLRLTIDSNVCYREGRWAEDGYGQGRGGQEHRGQDSYGHQLLPPGACLMELKTSTALPLTLTRVLDELGLYPRGFSKVGNAYRALTDKRRAR